MVSSTVILDRNGVWVMTQSGSESVAVSKNCLLYKYIITCNFKGIKDIFQLRFDILARFSA